MENNLLDVKNLKISFKVEKKYVSVVDGISFAIQKGETLGLVGESGCGKSVTSFSILNLLPENGCKLEFDHINFKGSNIGGLSFDKMRKIRGNDIGFVFQDALSSLDPVFTVGYQLAEAIRAHKKVAKDVILKRSVEMLKKVGLNNPEERINDYPHQLSGGMRQRVMIAIALINHPDLLIADEPTTSLDVTIQAQILQLLKNLKEDIGLSVLFVSHDLAVISEIADRIIVMYAGRIVEVGKTSSVLTSPLHPYTKGLLASIPEMNKNDTVLKTIPGLVPNISELSKMKGCYFADRCPVAIEKCRIELPSLGAVDFDHRAACFLIEDGV